MKEWEILEEECLNYLKNKYPTIKFTLIGKENSTKSDILVKTINLEFYIEVKSKISQCGQFVLIPNYKNNVFIYSSRNKTPIFEQTKDIINYMNFNFSKFANPTTAPLEIDLKESILTNWVINYYESKKVKFMITKTFNNYLLFPLKKLNNYFFVKCFYRIKKSGSTNASIFSKNDLLTWWKFSNEGEFIIEGKSLYFYTNKNVQKQKIKTINDTYLLNKISNNKYEIRKLSKTFNANVIFQIKLKNEKPLIDDLNEFEQIINN